MSFESYNGGGRRPPQNPEQAIEELLAKFNYFINNLFKKPKLFGIAFVVLLLVFTALTSFYTVQPDEEAVIIRLGKYSGTYPPGLHFKLPFGIDRLEKLKTKLVHQAEFGFRTRASSNFNGESVCS